MSTTRLALFGHPISHSPSPRVHQAFAAQFDIEIEYRLIDATTETFAGRLEAFRAGGAAGCNITLPLKQLACDLADQHSQRAAMAGAANTLVFTADGLCRADNTDGEGLVRDLQSNAGFDLAGKKILLLGAGGAAAGVLGALLRERPSHVVLVNRTVERAIELARRHESVGEVRCLGLDAIGQAGPIDLAIDATSMGHAQEPPAIPGSVFSSAPLCYSLNYGQAAQPWATVAQGTGSPFRDGLGMLVEQAACSFEIWTGRRPRTGPVLDAIRRPAAWG